MIPATEKVIKLRPYRIHCQKIGSCFWSVNYTRSKIPFLCSGNKLQIFKYPPFERTLCIDTYRINFIYQKMELQGHITYLWGEKIWYWNTFRFSSGKRHQNHDVAATLIRRRKHNVVTTVVFGCSNDLGNNVATLSQRYPRSRPKYNQNLTLLQRRVPAGLLRKSVIRIGLINKTCYVPSRPVL